MNLQDLTKLKIGILGFGQEGQAVLSYLGKHDLKATIYDEKSIEDWADAAQELAKKFANETITGPDYLDDINNCQILFRSPGIWRKSPQILNAESNGSIITSQTKWFFENTSANIIGVTGTKGKGTTSSLIYEILKEAGKNVYLTGNIGKIQPLEFLDQTTAEDAVVFELSSFQLQDLTISPHIGICLMVTSDHLNHHADLEEYHGAKTSITAFQNSSDIAIYNADYPASEIIGQMGNGQKLIVSAKNEYENGAFILDNVVTIIQNGIETDIDCSKRMLRGAHNLENIAAASLAAVNLNIPTEIIKKVCNEFKGLEHRLQYVATKNGVAYYNDSISTVPETTIAAINAFSEPIHLLLGGSEKGLSYSNLITALVNKKNIKSITLLGVVGEKLKPLLEQQILEQNSSIKLLGPYTDFSAAVQNISQSAHSGDVVLLSPASASFDMFKNYAERGTIFVQLVNAL